MYDSRHMVKENNIVFTLTPFTTEASQLYTFSFDTGGYYTTNSYFIWYNSAFPTEDSRTYRIRFESHYDDTIQDYRIRYTSGSETSEKTNRYLIRYSLSGLDEVSNYYSIRFESESPTENTYRKIYKVRYTSNGAADRTLNYKIKFTEQPYRVQTQGYKIKFTSDAADAHTIRSVVLSDGISTDLVGVVEGEMSLIHSLFVTNLPRFTLHSLGEVATEILAEEEVAPLNLFNENVIEKQRLYFRVKGVDVRSPIFIDLKGTNSVDLSTTLNYDPSRLSATAIVVSGKSYSRISYNDNYDLYSKLKFVTTTVTPVLSLSSSCCFSTKIKSGSSGTACSPF